jgi:hypothetical protein
MEHLRYIVNNLPVEFIFVTLAVFGGCARYLNGFTNGVPFRFSIFIASGLVAGFSGYMFALLGTSLDFPQTMLFMMAGTGGFFGEQTLKFVMEYITHKSIGETPKKPKH